MQSRRASNSESLNDSMSSMMSDTYLAYHFFVVPVQPATEILIAELGYAGFESFVENEHGVTAYIQKQDYHKGILDGIYVLHNKEFDISYTVEEITQTNWNREWEQNFEPIEVDGIVSVRAPFHDNKQLQYDIIIEPKMSFGTGHHETTYLMIQQLLALVLNHKSVLDMGSGTGILAIFSEMKGAKQIDAIDIDAWCYQNAIENCERNNCKHISVYKGDVSLLINKTYDVIIANINRNILLADMAQYVACLRNNGVLLLSGFYQDDIPFIEQEASSLGLKLSRCLERNNWVSLKFTAS